MSLRGPSGNIKVICTPSTCISAGKFVNDENCLRGLKIYSLFQFKSARHAYENCVWSNAKAKCKPESAKFTKSLVELLSNERQFRGCASMEKSLCSQSTRLSPDSHFGRIFYIFTVLFLSNYLCKIRNFL